MRRVVEGGTIEGGKKIMGGQGDFGCINLFKESGTGEELFGGKNAGSKQKLGGKVA